MAADSERRCILSGEHAAPDHLIRLAIGPDGQVLPDVRAKAPGRGAWLGISRAELETAQVKGKLRGALARAFKGEPLTVPEDLAERIDDALRLDFLGRLGLEARSSTLINGFDKINNAARGGQVRLLMHAADAKDDGVRKLDQAWRVGEEEEGTDMAGTRLPVDRNALSMAGERVRTLLDRWQSYLGCAKAAPAGPPDAGPSPSGPDALDVVR
jgi:predicted RNA-binding protein YlxR (DUF448 family)